MSKRQLYRADILFRFYGAEVWRCICRLGSNGTCLLYTSEYLLALDSEMYFGRSAKVRKLLGEGEYRSPFTAYYYNLLNAQQNRLPDRLMDGYQPVSYTHLEGKLMNKL